MANVEPIRSSQHADRIDRLAPEERAVIAAIRETRFGAVEVIVHQSRVVQLVRSEKVRFEPAAST
ncbi:MAG: DUF2292 domain-containing protein [Pseudomarimonas sp.]